MFPKHTNSTEMGSGLEAIVVTVSHVLGDLVKSVCNSKRTWSLMFDRQGASEAAAGLQFKPN